MARKVKCALTKEPGTSDTFYKADNGKYYKSKEIYDAWHSDVQKRTQARKLLLEYMDWKEGEPFPTLLTKKLKELDYYSGQVILDTVCTCSSSLEWAIKNKNFLSTTSKIHYVFAIISNKIADINKQANENMLSKEPSEKSAEKYISDIIDSQETQAKPQVKDLSAWLGEDDEL